MVAIENEMQGMSEYALAPEISTSFQSKMAARAAGIGSDVLEAMPLKDFLPALLWRSLRPLWGCS